MAHPDDPAVRVGGHRGMDLGMRRAQPVFRLPAAGPRGGRYRGKGLFSGLYDAKMGVDGAAKLAAYPQIDLPVGASRNGVDHIMLRQIRDDFDT